MFGPSWAAVLGSRTRVDADNRSLTNPLTGETDGGAPPVRFGGRGSGQPLSLPLSFSPPYPARAHQMRPQALLRFFAIATQRRFSEEWADFYDNDKNPATGAGCIRIAHGQTPCASPGRGRQTGCLFQTLSRRNLSAAPSRRHATGGPSLRQPVGRSF